MMESHELQPVFVLSKSQPKEVRKIFKKMRHPGGKQTMQMVNLRDFSLMVQYLGWCHVHISLSSKCVFTCKITPLNQTSQLLPLFFVRYATVLSKRWVDRVFFVGGVVKGGLFQMCFLLVQI